MSAKERKLTEKEQKRATEFEKLSRKMLDDGYSQRDLTIGILYANMMALFVACPVVILLGIVYVMVHPEDGNLLIVFEDRYLIFAITFFISIIVLTVLHELIHGLTWAFFTEKHWKSISFGVIWSALTPYCTCNEPLNKNEYILGSIAPTVILGLAPMLIAIVVGSPFLFLLGAMMYLGGGGDIMIILKMLRFKANGSEILYFDHPYKVGLIVFEK